MLRSAWLAVGASFFALAAVAAPPAPPIPAPDFNVDQTPAKPLPFPLKKQDLGNADPRLKGITAPEGFKVEIVADEKTVINPVGMTFAPDGTLFVLEWRTDPGRDWSQFNEIVRYRDGTVREVATMKKHTFDTIKQMTWNPKTGTYDKAEVILTEELPSTILFHDSWLYVASRGTVRRYKQSKAGGKWDTREVIAQGFCGFHHHQVSGLTIGNDGLLYITTGDDDNVVEGSDGSRASVMRTGAVFRCKPDGSKMEVFSLGYRNPYRDITADDRFNFFHTDNDQEDGSKFQGCRIVHVAEESDYGWRLKDGARCCRTDFVRGAVAGERPGKLAPMIKTGRGSPAGLLIYNDTQLPQHYRGLLYYPDVFRKLIRAYKVEQFGSSFAITHELEFMGGTDPLFRPCHMATGPDGAIYICDWRTDSGGAGKLFGDGVHGRIYRLTWTGTKEHPAIAPRSRDTWKQAAGPDVSLEHLTQGLRSPDMTTRQVCQAELLRRAKKNPDLIRAIFRTDADPETQQSLHVRLHSLGGLMQLWNDECQKFFVACLQDAEPDVRRIAAEGLGMFAKPKDLAISDSLTKSLRDESLAVRRAAALAIGRIGADGAADLLVSTWKLDDGKDAFLTDAFVRGIERLGKPGIHSLLSLASSGQKADLDRVASLFPALRSRAAVDAIPDFLLNPHIPPAQRAELVRCFVNFIFDTPLSLDPLAAYLASRPNEADEVKVAGLDTLAYLNALNTPKATAFVMDLLDAKSDEVRLAAIQAVEAGRVFGASSKLLEALQDAKRPAGERIAILKAARSLGDKNLAKLTLAFLEREGEPAAIKVEALRTAAALDPGAARKIAEQLLDSPDQALLTEAVLALGSTKAGAKLVGERYLAKKLPRDLFPRVSEVLRKFPNDSEIAKLNTEVMRGGLLLSMEPSQMEKVRKEVLTKGDAKKGKAVYLNSSLVACASCHKMEGVGGSVGPDLTRIWDTHTIEKLMEAIVEPSKEIKEGYQSYKVATLGGQIFSGLKISETPKEVVLREANGRDVRFKKDDLDEFAPSKISLMPDNAASQLTYEQFIDLLAFLKNRKEQESLRGAVLEFAVLPGVSADLKPVAAVESALDPKSQPAGKKVDWQLKPTDPTGLLHLKPLLPSEPAGVYLLTYVQSAKKQTVSVGLLMDDPVRIQIGNAKAFERPVPKLNNFAQEEKFEVTLEPGWTPVLLKVLTTGATHRVGLQFTGDGLRVSPKAE